MARRAKNQRDNSEKALRTLQYAMLVGILAVMIYSIESENLIRLVTTIGTGVVVAAAALVIGGLLGFLFGIPRTLQQPILVPADGAPDDTKKSAAVDWPTGKGPEYQANPNLEQISDWLTKILVGVGLIRVREIEDKLHTLEADIRSKDAQATSLGTGKGNTDEVKKKLLVVTDGLESGNPDDPWKGQFGGTSVKNDREIRAEVKPIRGSSRLYAIRLTVKSLYPEKNSLKGAVQFFLHPTFNDPTPVVPVGSNGVAELNLKA